MRTLEAIRMDIRLCHTLRYPGRPATWWSRAQVVLGSRGLLLLAHHRLAQVAARWSARGPLGQVLTAGRKLAMVAADYAVSIATRSELRLDTAVEPGVYVAEQGCVFIGARVVGEGTMIHDHVTIGRNAQQPGMPEIGRNVWIGPHAVIVGNVKVGDGATVMPYTVLTRSVPAGFVAQGNPASFVRRGFDNAGLRSTLETDVDRFLADRQAG